MRDYLNIQLNDEKISGISNLGLAHIGDAVFELLVRSWLCCHGKATSKGLHKSAVTYVSAPAQAKAAEKIMSELTEEEKTIYKRGRNTKVNSVPSRASLGQYHSATGLEALFGWLFLKGRQDRINELFNMIMEEHGNAT